MNKVKIAKQLVKIAKELVSEENIANQPGEYKNFTGEIKWKGTRGKVRNATFELFQDGDYDKDILWYDGIWEKGTFNDGYWKKGIWKGGTWNGGTWRDGIFENGTWDGGTWKDGTWEYGKWLNGKDKSGKTHGRDDSPDKW